MTRALERTELEAELAAAERVLTELPESFVIERLGFLDRIEDIRGRLVQLRCPPARNAQVAMYFAGAPAIGSQGVEAEFAGTGIARFQAIVAAVGGQQRDGISSLEPEGSLHVTAVLHGSFGFQLEELDQPLLGETALASTVDETLELLVAAKATDTTSLDTRLEDGGTKVHGAVRSFFSHLAQHGAGVRVVGELQQVAFDPREASETAHRVSAVEISEETVTVEGVFGGELSFSRTFELRTVPENRVIRGHLLADASPNDFDVWHHKRCRAVLRVQTRTRGEQTAHRYMLVRLEPPTPTDKSG